MPPRNKTQKRKHDVLEAGIEKSKTRRLHIKTQKGRHGPDVDKDESERKAQLKQKTRKGTHIGSQALSNNQLEKPLHPKLKLKASSSQLDWGIESQTTTTNQAQQESNVARSDSDSNSEPLPPIKDKPATLFNGSEDEDDLAKPFRHRRAMRRTRQRSLLEYVVPAEGKGKQRMNMDTGEEDSENNTEYDPNLQYTEVHRFNSNSDSDSPRKIRFEPPLRSKTNLASSPKRVIHAISESSLDGDVEIYVQNQTRRNESANEGTDEDLSPPPRRRRLVRGIRPNSGLTGAGELSSEDEELIEEAKEKDSLKISRFRNGSKKSDFLRNLERLKRKRKGEESEGEEDDEEEEDANQKVDPPNRATKKLHLGNDIDIFADAKPTDVYSLDEDSQGENDDFIVEDEEASVELPPMFNIGTFQDLSHHFKVVCQLFVHLSVKKRGHRTDFMKEALKNNYFSVPISMMRRKLLGLRDSLVASSIWKPQFRKLLETYPDFTIQQLDLAVPHCDACNLSGRISTLQGLLRGTKYDFATYQDTTKEININWNLGRFCAARAQVFHKLTHWEYMLFHKFNLEIDYLRKGIEDHQSSRRSIFIPATKGPPPPDDLKDADGLMEWLDGRGIIEAEWLEIKNMMDKAHKLEAKRKGGEDDVEYS